MPISRPHLIPRVPALDGLRGLAVLSVVVYHLFPGTLRGGYLGVDMFFVLSGFLITSLMLREHVLTGGINLKKFWTKRVRRIVPAAVTVLFSGAALAGLFQSDATVGLGRQLVTGLFFASNWGQIAASRSYFASPELFAHFWSLAVEEQFYVVWPVVVAGLLAALGAKRLKAISAVFFAVALVSMAGMLALYTPGQDPTRVYYGTDTHAFSLLIGAALAAWLVRASKSGDAWGTRGGRGRGQWLGGAVEVAGFVGVRRATCRDA